MEKKGQKQKIREGWIRVYEPTGSVSYEYVPDIGTALTEMYRVLRPGGRAAIISTDWKAIAQ